MTQQSCLNVVPHIILHRFGRFGMEVHCGNRKLKKDSKSEALFCAKPLRLYEDRDNLDNTDVTDTELGD